MKMKKIRKRAAKAGVKAGKMKKVDLVHAIQVHEGNIPCFRTGDDLCDQEDCCWRKDCLPAVSNEASEIVQT
ncbi:hypothetical protein H206_01840 [Candidatus Electrothrix aarhusensis]|jgi:hypothetical protein|uniref:SAP domain-containing protein n=1 Tax=Candidatus Electrothrix aarhusensis TaxID=1859131 RepID=A0A444ITS3_9BACT|nr:hypothetical protein H206_01840 [Candidatus Electrothrix aarhusensis]